MAAKEIIFKPAESAGHVIERMHVTISEGVDGAIPAWCNVNVRSDGKSAKTLRIVSGLAKTEMGESIHVL